MLLATKCWPCLLQDVPDVYCSKQTGSSSTKGNHHLSFLRFWNWAEENCRWPKFVAAQKMLLKTENPANIRKWIARFYYFRHLYSAGSACVHWLPSCPSIWATLSALLINILLGSFQLFLHSDQPLWGWNNSFSGVASRGCIHRRRRWWLQFLLTDRLLCATDDDQRQTSSRRASFSALASANSSCILHRRSTTSRWRISVLSVIAAFKPASVLWHFCRAGLCRQWRYHGN